MTVAREKHVENTVLGNGEVYVELLGAGEPDGSERYLGDGVSATLSITTERTTILSGDGAIAKTLADTVRSVERTLSFAIRDSSIPNWALFLIGETESIDGREDDGDEVTVTGVEYKKGRTYVLGQTAALPFGVGVVKDVKVEKPAGTDVPEGDDSWRFDPALGRITFFADQPNTTVIKYKPATGQPETMIAKTSAAARQQLVRLRYVEDEPASGKGRSVYVRRANLVSGGESALKSRDTEQQLSFTATVLNSNDAYPDVVVHGEA